MGPGEDLRPKSSKDALGVTPLLELADPLIAFEGDLKERGTAEDMDERGGMLGMEGEVPRGTGTAGPPPAGPGEEVG